MSETAQQPDRVLVTLRALLQFAGSRQTRAPVFGLAHDWQVMDDVPRDEDDQLVDAIRHRDKPRYPLQWSVEIKLN